MLIFLREVNYWVYNIHEVSYRAQATLQRSKRDASLLSLPV